jgi:molecular chaperone HscB
MTCTTCHQPARGGLLCDCGAILPPRPNADRFAALGVPRTYALDTKELEVHYRDLSRKLHPDRFAKAPPRERMLSLQAATTLNEAYRVLRTPVRRAEYLLDLFGAKVGDQDPVEPGFLMEILELREELGEAKAAGDAASLSRLFAAMQERKDAAMRRVADGFAAYEHEPDAALLADVKVSLVSLRYFQRFLDEHEAHVDQELG